MLSGTDRRKPATESEDTLVFFGRDNKKDSAVSYLEIDIS